MVISWFNGCQLAKYVTYALNCFDWFVLLVSLNGQAYSFVEPMRLSKKTQAAVRAGAGVTMKQLNHVPKRQKRQSLTPVDHRFFSHFLNIFSMSNVNYFSKGFWPGHLVASTWLFPLLEAQDWKHTGSDVLGTCASKSHHTGGWRAVFWHFILLNRSRVPQAQMYEEAWTAYSKQKFSEVWTVWRVWIGRVSQKNSKHVFLSQKVTWPCCSPKAIWIAGLLS